MEELTSRDIADLDPELQVLCREFLLRCNSENIKAFVTCTYRSNEEQDADYAKGRTTPGKIITNAKAGQSKHNCTIDGKPAARAFDVAIRNDDGSVDWNPAHPHWKRMGEIGQEVGLVWGGSWLSIKDYPHFQLKEII